MVAFLAQDRATVDEAYALALRNGGFPRANQASGRSTTQAIMGRISGTPRATRYVLPAIPCLRLPLHVGTYQCQRALLLALAANSRRSLL
jgi:hypothetical protein